MVTAVKDRSLITFTNHKNNKKARFDLKDNSCYTFYNNKFNKVKNLKNFFSGYDTNKIINGFEDDKYKKFINMIWQEEDRCTNVGTLLERLYKYSNLENYILMNIKVARNVSLKTSEINKYILKYIIKRNLTIDRCFEETYKTHMDLILKIIRYIDISFDDNTNKNIWNFIKDWSFESHFIKLIDTYNYEYKSLLNYLFDFLPNREGYTVNSYSIRTLEDYASMQKAMSKKGKFNKYPKYLKTVHDITVSNYNTFKKEYSDELFKNRINNDLAYESKKYNYIIKIPQSCNDIKQEGVDMHNCVGSYIEKIIDGKTQIIFLRRLNKPNESLVTVEIRDNKLVQAYRAYNTNLVNEEIEFLKKYCKEKNIEYKLRY
ncbi:MULTISPECIES: PcfJ domain-containing protein [unclassified Clostridium]|uniref:PcfJ domain-containing protein n=1 Tax=unclassified Clostridium TaxID=2614128 RepID=UPI00207944A4|nr:MULTISPECIES: PcfJ domain-containing protein [unclassified Clostridium]